MLCFPNLGFGIHKLCLGSGFIMNFDLIQVVFPVILFSILILGFGVCNLMF